MLIIFIGIINICAFWDIWLSSSCSWTKNLIILKFCYILIFRNSQHWFFSTFLSRSRYNCFWFLTIINFPFRRSFSLLQIRWNLSIFFLSFCRFFPFLLLIPWIFIGDHKIIIFIAIIIDSFTSFRRSFIFTRCLSFLLLSSSRSSSNFTFLLNYNSFFNNFWFDFLQILSFSLIARSFLPK